ncbi:MAG: acyl-CoA dehydrogenase [Henriciella sp.]|uniref:acyl-CoA dehydrogenase C-terminal domain-containing protein n=1 Tax=Henriciella sp. TaxID=1968823 RepID=UPI000C1009ED|nr:acyl-CoA dehydrogenase C-terminal domain-containing protein [Henriciella sp.]MAN75182.1 acyl-CoA dehydrogenase [Henriciella sp.]MBF33297.1 acyl-CoA dehydrogenase [Hyphomonadaceae bacterium]MBK76383.1 acyl-CoA dehydrogenase [Henriciella sp.]PHR68833.1 MAG: acyl-CoA dehydrogenase [Henriciella sp.]|tara:strand:+ start:4216 stop:5997 length:1782 start_codon:yes stop_codon:yes gene_type:complete
MPRYDAPIRDMQFIFHDVLALQNYSNLEGFSDATPDIVDQILETGGKFASEVLFPLNKVGDAQGCKRAEDASVKTPDGFPDAYKQFVENGWPLLSKTPEMGGQGLPNALSIAISEMMSSANMAFAMYPGLTSGAYEALMAGGSDEQKQKYGPKMATGEWAGTMNLTEPQCGTDLGLIKTKAVPQEDGSYKITGQKIWISGGEQDLTDNIVHLVLARIEGAPEGIKGISLFVVPKYMVKEDGSLGERNALSCGGLEEKMGIHGNATCVMNYDGATGWLVGDEHKGMRTMFVMMNEARLGVGLQGLAQAEVAYQNAADFARERLQSRALTGPAAPDKPADPIIVHPDVRRLLMDTKSFVEGGRLFTYWTALHGDLLHKSPDEKMKEKAGDYMALMTPVVKAFLTDRGLKACNDALQLHGGTGFTREQGVEQFVRDVRIALIYEGTNGIQALDLVGRKLAANGGRAVFTFFAEMDDFIGQHEGNEEMKPFVEGLSQAKAELQDATTWLMQNGMSNFNNAGAASTDYLHLFGLTALGFMWAKMAEAALEKRGDDPFYDDKLVTGRYYMSRILPETAAHLAKLKTGAEPLMALEADRF